MKTLRLTLALALVPLVSACLENEEEIEIRPDGSVRITVSSNGDVADLADGYALPLQAPWQTAAPDTELWIARFGAQAGGPGVRARLSELGWPEENRDDPKKAALSVYREFPSVAAMPRWYSPAADPYREAYLERSSSLEILERGARRVYVFERTYHGRLGDRFDLTKIIGELLEDTLTKEHLELIQQGELLPREAWAKITTLFNSTYRRVAEMYAREALEGIYTRGDASFAPDRLPAVYAAVGDAVTAIASPERLQQIYTIYATGDDDEAGRHFDEMTEAARQALRDSLASQLLAEGMNRPTVNAVLFALEWSFTAVDHTGDLGDEDFIVKVTMPGVLVGGNFDETSGSTAAWRFDVADIGEDGKRMRVISVLE